MPKPRWPHLHKEINRHGKTVWYVRVHKGPRTRIKDEFGTPAFEAAYRAALAKVDIVEALKKPTSGTIMWALSLYRNSSAWAGLSFATRKQRGCILRKIETGPVGASKLLKDIGPAAIKAGVRRLGNKPAAARHFVATMRGFFKWAVDEDLVKADPTQGLAVKQKATDGHLPWTDEDIEAYEARWPLGTRERVALDVLLYTGLRRGDAVQVGRQHVKGGVVRIKTEKTGEWVAIVICPELARSIAAGPCGELTFIAGERGRPRVKESFGEWFRSACHAAGVTKTAHGLRKAAATRAANNRASEAELEAMFGWRGGKMAAHYTRAANREALAIGAAHKLSRSKS